MAWGASGHWHFEMNVTDSQDNDLCLSESVKPGQAYVIIS